MTPWWSREGSGPGQPIGWESEFRSRGGEPPTKASAPLILSAILAVVDATSTCTTDVRLAPVASGVTTPSSKTVYERRHEETEARETRWLGRSADGQTGFKELLVGWRGPGTTPRKAVVPYPLIVHDGPYRFRVSRIYGGPYRSRWGGWCWNYVYRAEQKPG